MQLTGRDCPVMLTDGATGDAFSSDLGIGGAMSDIASEQPAQVQPVVREVASGLVGSVLALAYAFSYAALIFTGPLAPFAGAPARLAFRLPISDGAAESGARER
jgi:hypothetical protein